MKIKNFLLVSSFYLAISGCSDAQQKEQEQRAEICELDGEIAGLVWLGKERYVQQLERYKRGEILGPDDKPDLSRTQIQFTNMREMKAYDIERYEKRLDFDESISQGMKRIYDLIYMERNLNRWSSAEEVETDFKESCIEGNL